MKLRYRTWRRLYIIAGLLICPAMFYFFITDDMRRFEQIFWFVLAPLGFSGALMAFGQRFGWLEIIYTEKDRESLAYKLAQEIAAKEHGSDYPFSKKYFANYGIVDRPKTKNDFVRNP